MLVALKLLLAPLLVALVTLIGRALGPRVSGFLAALPIIAGPAVWLVTEEQGASFGAEAALSCALGSAGTTVFALGFVLVAPRLNWLGCASVGYLGFALASVALSVLPITPWLACALPVAVHMGFLRYVDKPHLTSFAIRPPSWDLPLRMLLTALLVLGITTVAASVGPHWSGLLTPFPVATSVLSSFARAQQGAAAATHLLRGLVLGLNTFAIFFVTLGLCLARVSVPLSFGLSIAMALCVHGLLAWLHRRQG